MGRGAEVELKSGQACPAGTVRHNPITLRRVLRAERSREPGQSGSSAAAKRDEVVMATKAIVGEKVGMTQVWDAEAVNETTGKTMALFRCTQMVLYPR